MIYNSIRPEESDLRLLQYKPNGKIYYKLHFVDELRELHGRPKQVQTVTIFPDLYTSRAKIPRDKWNELQFLKMLMPSDTHKYYNNIPCEDDSRKRHQENEKLKQEKVMNDKTAKKKILI